MASSITRQILDAVVACLESAAPETTIVKKGRKVPQRVKEGRSLVQVYWLQETSRAIGNPRNPMLHSRNGVLQIKVTVAGDDDAFDVERIWILAALWNVGNLSGLIKDMEEAETVYDLEDSSEDGAITASAIRYAVEYTTRPGDITAAN